jgi:hypothetical protein
MDVQHRVLFEYLREANILMMPCLGHPLREPNHDILPALGANWVGWRVGHAPKRSNE